MKKITISCLVVLSLASCRKVQQYPMPSQPNVVGTLNVSPNPTTGQVTMSFLLDANVKYNLSITGMDNKVYKSFSINSVGDKVEKTENLSTLPEGTYDLILMDITGRQYKTPLIIKK